MRRWTEPKQRFTCDCLDFTELSNINFDYRQGKVCFTIPMSRMTIEEHRVEFYLTEEETLSLCSRDNVRIQMRAELDGRNIASKLVSVPVGEILREGDLM